MIFYGHRRDILWPWCSLKNIFFKQRMAALISNNTENILYDVFSEVTKHCPLLFVGLPMLNMHWPTMKLIVNSVLLFPIQSGASNVKLDCKSYSFWANSKWEVKLGQSSLRRHSIISILLLKWYSDPMHKFPWWRRCILYDIVSRWQYETDMEAFK